MFQLTAHHEVCVLRLHTTYGSMTPDSQSPVVGDRFERLRVKHAAEFDSSASYVFNRRFVIGIATIASFARHGPPQSQL